MYDKIKEAIDLAMLEGASFPGKELSEQVMEKITPLLDDLTISFDVQNRSNYLYIDKNGKVVTANAGPHEVLKREADAFKEGGADAVRELSGDYCGSKAAQAEKVAKLLKVIYVYKEV